MDGISCKELSGILRYKLQAWKNNDSLLLENLGIYKYNLFTLKKRIEVSSKEAKKLYSKFVEKNVDILIYDMLYQAIKINKKKLDSENIFDTIKIIVKELLEYEKVSFSSIEHIGYGSSSNVYKIGEKVLKLGFNRESFLIPNDKRYLKPVIRTFIKSLNSDSPLIYIEVTEYVDKVDLSEDELYEFYKSFREDGKILLDFDSYNLGRLRKKNKVYFNGINPSFETVNYTTESNEELDSGELVIIDNEYVVSVKEYYDNIDNYEIFEASEYEERYVYEKKHKKI